MKHFKNLVKPYVLWSFINSVLLLIMLYSVTKGSNSGKYSVYIRTFVKIFEPVYLNVFFKSLQLGLITTVICLALGYPMAYFISKTSDGLQNILILLVTIPMWINTLLRTYAWISLLSDNGLINSLLKFLGLSEMTMMYTDFSVIVGLVCDLLPFMVVMCARW